MNMPASQYRDSNVLKKPKEVLPRVLGKYMYIVQRFKNVK